MRIEKVHAAVFLLFFSPLLSYSQTPADSSPQDQSKYHTDRALQYLSEHRPDLAIPELQSVVALDPKNVDALANLGVLEYFRGEYSDAIPQFRAALAQQPKLWKIQALLGIAEVKTGDSHAGRADLEAAFPHLQEKKFKVQVGNDLIENYADTGDLDKAAIIASEIRKLDPTNINAIYTSYRLYSDLADEAMVTMAMTAPKSAQLHQMMAHQLARRGNIMAAIANDREALKIDPKLAGVHYEIAEMMHASVVPQIHAQAEEEYKAALAQNPNDDMSELRLGEIAAKRGDLKAAEVDDERALAIQPKNAEACTELAKVFMSLNQPLKAKKLFEQAIQIDPTSAVAHFRLSSIYRQEGRSADAKRELEEFGKYNNMKTTLQKTIHNLTNASAPVQDDTDATK
jgi:tetratricopeptide (TPR) repeat protein